MDIIQTYVNRISTELQFKGYLIENRISMGDTPGLLYACSAKPYQTVITRVSDHFLFVDWECGLARWKSDMIETYRSFSKAVNQKFKVPNVFRLTIPSMILVAVSTTSYGQDTIDFVQSVYETPMKGGEAGQYMLVDLALNKNYYHTRQSYKQPAATPLYESRNNLLPVMQRCLQVDYAFPSNKKP